LPGWTPIGVDQLPERVAQDVLARAGAVRVAVDGAPAAEPAAFAESLVPLLERAGRPVGHVRAETFWRDASLRLEYGREDVDSYLTGWLDAAALLREVLVPLVEQGRYLPSLRDPVTNRSTRERPRPLGPDGIVLVSGPLLLAHGLPFDRTVHLHLSPAALARRTPPEAAWTLPAFRRYDATVAPARTADVVIKLDDPRHPAVQLRTPPARL